MLIPGNFSEMFKKQPKEFEIPVLVGDTVENVKEKYKDLKIDFIIDEEVFDNDNPAGTIVSHDPLAGMNVKLPVKVRLVVSKGPKEITLSRYIDKEYRQAELEIKNLGLKCTKVEEYNEEVPEGYVIAQDPLPDTEVKSGWEVILTVSKGADEEFAVVPDLKGLTEAEAKAKLADNDLVLGGIIRKASKEKEGTVIDQSQPKDSELAKKSKIVITVSKGNGTEDKTETDKPTENKPAENKPTENKPAVTEKNYVLNLDLPSSQESVRVTVKQSGKLVYDKSVKTSAKTLNITLTGSGQSNIEVYFDGSLVKTQKISF
jgi:serine/threonine-protein kinase